MTTREMTEKLRTYGQTHLLTVYEQLDAAGQNAMRAQIAAADFEMLRFAQESDNATRGPFAVPEAMPLETIQARRAELEVIGLRALAQGKVGAVLLAGGQGSRLGYNGPKGAMNIGKTRELSLFQLHFETLTRYAKAAGCPIPLFIMVSYANETQTRTFLEEKAFFGYPRDAVYFFPQEMALCTDFDGKLFLDAPAHIAEGPNGNGGWFSSMLSAGLMPTLARLGIEWLDVFAVDNALQKIADPCFVGAVLASGCEAGAKVVRKCEPDERVGVLCLENGVPSIVEYYDAERVLGDLRLQRDADGGLTYRYGVILNYLFSLNRLREIGQARLPLHKARKALPYLAADGSIRKPDAPNGFKYETLVLDMVRLQRSCLAYEVEREQEFAPIKVMTGTDSLESARTMLEAAGFSL